jgi:hypothetical protein
MENRKNFLDDDPEIIKAISFDKWLMANNKAIDNAVATNSNFNVENNDLMSLLQDIKSDTSRIKTTFTKSKESKSRKPRTKTAKAESLAASILKRGKKIS